MRSAVAHLLDMTMWGRRQTSPSHCSCLGQHNMSLHVGDHDGDDDDDFDDDDDECNDDDDENDDECADDIVVSSCWEFARGSLLSTLSLSSCPGPAAHHFIIIIKISKIFRQF